MKSDDYNEVANHLISNFDKFKSKEESLYFLNDEITSKGLIPEIPLTEGVGILILLAIEHHHGLV